jgi:integrase
MKSLTREELGRLLAAADESPIDRLMFTGILNHGLHVSEAISLTDANIVDGHLVVQRLKGSRRKCQPLLPDEKELADMRGRFFPISRWVVRRKIRFYGRKASIPAFKLHPHALKHTTGRLAYQGGMGVAELVAYLGHKNPANSLIYAQSDEATAASGFAAATGRG